MVETKFKAKCDLFSRPHIYVHLYIYVLWLLIFFLFFFSALEDSRPHVVSNTIWLCILVLQLFIVANVEKHSLQETSCFFIKNLGIQTRDLMHANGVEKDFYLHINLLNIDAEFTRVKNHLNVTCVTRDSLIPGMY